MASHDESVFVITHEDLNEFCRARGVPLLSDIEISDLGMVMDDFVCPWLGITIHELRHPRAI